MCEGVFYEVRILHVLLSVKIWSVLPDPARYLSLFYSGAQLSIILDYYIISILSSPAGRHALVAWMYYWQHDAGYW